MALQKELRGFKGFIGLFKGGNFPINEVNTLQPVVEMEDWLKPNNFRFGSGAVASGNTLQFTVPEGEFWRMKWMLITITPQANQDVQIMPFLKRTLGGAVRTLGLTPCNVAGFQGVPSSAFAINGQVTGVGIPLDKLNAEPTDAIGVQVTDVNGGVGNPTVDLYAQYQLIDV